IRGLRIAGLLLGILGVGLAVLLHWQVFFWVPTEATMGVVQRIFYIHVPAAWVAFMAFGIVALCGAVYLWLGDERLDMAAVSAAEGGMVFTTIVLVSGPLWGRVAWGTWWTWEPRLTLTLLLWFIYLGYFLVRSSTESPQRGKRFAAVTGIVGALNIPLIHVSVVWFRSLHPEPVVLRPDGPSLDPAMLQTLLTGFLTYTVIFFSVFFFRYGLARLRFRRALGAPESAGRVPEGATAP
ncbi:MAG TPA: cytochrome c biogenesis protein CcsA, partial [Longimicrobiales bacterium]|nr:cytochrome c biogenesis protein CcsA [Longimicrobiales bacterium]